MHHVRPPLVAKPFDDFQDCRFLGTEIVELLLASLKLRFRNRTSSHHFSNLRISVFPFPYRSGLDQRRDLALQLRVFFDLCCPFPDYGSHLDIFLYPPIKRIKKLRVAGQQVTALPRLQIEQRVLQRQQLNPQIRGMPYLLIIRLHGMDHITESKRDIQYKDQHKIHIHLNEAGADKLPAPKQVV